MAFLFVTVCGITIGCDKTDDPKPQTTNDLSSSILSETITSYTSGKIDSVLILLSRNDLKKPYQTIGKGAISATGGFSVSLSDPESSCLSKISADEDFVGAISDTNAVISIDYLQIFGVKNMNPLGLLIRSNFSTLDSMYNNNSSYTIIVYCDRSLSVSGSTQGLDVQNGDTVQFIEKSNFSLKKGWNELVYEQKNTILSPSKSKVELILSSYTSTNLKWHFLDGQGLDFSESFYPVKSAHKRTMKFRKPSFFRK